MTYCIRPMVVVIGVTGIAVASATCGSDAPTDIDAPLNCEVIFSTPSQGDNPTTAIRVANRLSGGLKVSVDGANVFGTGSHMGPGECNTWGLPAGVYEVRLRQCTQDNPGSTQCTSEFGTEVLRSVTLDKDEIETIEVDQSLF